MKMVIKFYENYKKFLKCNNEDRFAQHHSTVYKSQDMEATQMSISRRMDKKAVVHTQWNITQLLKRMHLNQF